MRPLQLALLLGCMALVSVGCAPFYTCGHGSAPTPPAVSAKSVSPSPPEAKYAVQIFMLEPVYFRVGKYSLTPEATKVLLKESEWLRQNRETKIKISGNADKRSNRKYNRVLAQKRAEAVKNRLVELGISPDRMQVESYGAERPVCTKTTRNCYAANRRVDLRAVGRIRLG